VKERHRWAAIAALAAAGLVAGTTAAAAPSPASARGTYRLHGKARASTPPLLDRELDVHADAVLSPGRGPREVRARLAAQGQRCDLVAKLDDAGALTFEPGQRCVLEVDAPDARGRLDARLRSGRGRLGDGDLSLDLSWQVSGALSVRVTAGSPAMGIPETWAPVVPVRGEARGTAQGRRDESRGG
jgi:hypothetical protein